MARSRKKGEIEPETVLREMTKKKGNLQSTEFLQSVIDGIQYSIKIVDLDHNVIFANKAARDLVQSHCIEIVGGKCYREVYQNRKPCDFCQLPASIEEGVARRTEFTVTNEAGEREYFEVYTYPIFEDDGSVARIIETTRDITDQKRLEDQLVHSEKMAAMGTVVAGIAHEIKNPLAGIQLGLDLLAKRVMKERENCEIIKTITHDIRRLDRVLTQLLDFARKNDDRPESVLVEDVIDKTLFFVRKEAGSRGVSIEKEYTYKVSVDLVSHKIQQAFLNILINAVQAIEGKGTITISTKPHRCDERDGVLVRFRDTGCGIPAENLTKISELFFTTKKGGTGIGIAMSSKIIGEHNGQIRIESEPGRGTEVQVFLPARCERTVRKRYSES